MASLKDKTTAANSQPQTLVYVGPNMGGSTLMQQFTVFKDGLPNTLQARCGQDADFAALFVPVAELANARAAIARKGSELNRAYGAVWSAYMAKTKEGK